MDKWSCAPHYWTRCQKWAKHERAGLQVCRVHLESRVICAFDLPKGSRPHWLEWRVPRETDTPPED